MTDATYLVAGLGKSGVAAVSAIRKEFPSGKVIAWDASSFSSTRRCARRLRRLGFDVVIGRPIDVAFDEAGPNVIVVRSPGIPVDAEPVIESLRRGHPVLDEVEIGWRIHRQPFIAVTGTDGKGTTATLTAGLLKKFGENVALVGNFAEGPAASDVRNSDATTIVCEVSSYQLECTEAFLPDVAVFTNLTPWHLQRHGSQGDYEAAKTRMFLRNGRCAPVSVVNTDDAFGRRLAQMLRSHGGRVISFGSNASADVRLVRSAVDVDGVSLELCTDDQLASTRVKILGRHNAMNALAAVATATACGIEFDAACEGIRFLDGPRARSERVSTGMPFDIFRDYAHTRAGIVSVLSSLRNVVDNRPGASLRVVTGPLPLNEGANGVEWASPIVGEFSDMVIATSGHLSEMVTCPMVVALSRMARAGGVTRTILDRRAAITFALQSAHPGDVVLVISRGGLGRLTIDHSDTRIAFDDEKVIREICALMLDNEAK